MKRSVIFLSAAGALLLTAAEPVILPEHSPEKDISGFVAVDPLQHCEVSCRTQGGLGKLRISIRQYDAAKRPIAATHVNASPETFTELAEPLARGGNSIVVKDASKWSFPAKGRIVVFGAKKDLSDLPNRKKAYYVAGVVQKGNLYVVTFDRSVNFDAPVGTGVRLHRDGGNVSFPVPCRPRKRFRRFLNLPPRMVPCRILSGMVLLSLKFLPPTLPMNR